jgi:hypothetical protein
MQAPPAEGFGELDLDKIMATGGRIRRRRRILVSGGAVLMTALLLVGVTAVGQFRQRAPDVAQPGPTVTTAPAASTSTSPPYAKPPLGDMISTGIHDAQGELLIYFYAVDHPQLPDVHFGIAVAHRTLSGELLHGTANNDFSAGVRPGFHQVMGGDSSSGVFVPAFGYYVGPAARIEAEVKGVIVQARVVPWSEKSSIVAFWFPEDVLPDATLLGRPNAYDAQGGLLTR